MKRKSIAVAQYLDHKLLHVYENARLAGSSVDGNQENVRKACRNGTLYKGYHWKYEDPDLEDEVWKVHPSGIKVSSMGRVQNRGKCKDIGWMRYDGYRSVTTPGGKVKFVHRLVLEAFVEKPQGKLHSGSY